MHIARLSLYHFRCYDHLELELDPKFNVVVGLNGQGKTSLVEAIGLLSFFKSFRSAKNAEMLMSGAAEGRVAGSISHDGLSFELDVKLWPTRKQAAFNGKHCRFLSEYVGKLSAVSFAPTDLEIVRGAPENRRSWADRVAQVFFPTHVDEYANFQKAVEQRNFLLKDASKKNMRPSTELEIWDEQIVQYGSKIIQNRVVAIGQIQPSIQRHYERIANEKTPIFIRYLTAIFEQEDSGQNSSKHDSLSSLEAIQKKLSEALRMNLQKDLVLGTTSVGPHRDDLEVLLNANPAKAYGSQGEVRSLVLAMRLAEVEKIKEVKGYSPLLLIDDFSSELDANRRKFLLDFLTDSGSQVFLTTTEDIRMGKVFEVSRGRIIGNANDSYRQQL